ncbi:transglutaminase domain-containing protein [Sporosarcina sp. FSL K6-6792]|uniref:transglutaminase domain-containing protein n=1 Tax=Sporosarcina sp. FSL K6-6792 TaxID=2921559 RepID=UPI0030F88576
MTDAHVLLVFGENGTTCNGYTDLVAELHHRFGLESRLVAGDTHSWNAVKVGGKWYHTDSTWNDNLSGKTTKYLLMTQSERAQDIKVMKTTFKATDVKFNQSTAKAYSYQAIKKANAAKK